MQLWVLLITALVPLAIAPGLLSAFDITPKIAILLVCESVLFLFCKQIVNGVRALFESLTGKLFLACLAAEWLSTFLSTLASTNPTLSVNGSSWRRDGLIAESAILLFALMTAAWFIEDPTRIRTVLRAIAVTTIVASLYGIAQYFGFDPLLPSTGYQSGEGPFTIVRPPGTLGHADYFANWLVIAGFCSLALALQEHDRWWKRAAEAASILSGFAILMSGTRSALLGVVAGAVVFIVIARPRLHLREFSPIAGAVLCGAVLFISPAGAKLRARVHWSLDDARGGARLLLWRDSLLMSIHHPLLGFGPETFTSQFPPFVSVELSQAYPDFYQESPHNMFLDALTSRGIPGLLSLIALCAIGLWAARKNPALAAALVGAIVCQQFMVLTIPTALYFYLLIAMAIAGAIPSTQPKKQPFPLAIAPVAAGLAAIFLIFSGRLILADRAMTIAEQLAASGDVNGAASLYKAVHRFDPSGGDRDLRYSRAMTHLAATTSSLPLSVAAAQHAADAAFRATTTAEDRQNAWYNFATIAALRNDRQGVEQGLRHSIACAPNWFKPHWTLSQLLELTGRHAEARREALIALNLDGGHDPEVAETSRKILANP
jgi:O-antigen ligase